MNIPDAMDWLAGASPELMRALSAYPYQLGIGTSGPIKRPVVSPLSYQDAFTCTKSVCGREGP